MRILFKQKVAIFTMCTVLTVTVSSVALSSWIFRNEIGKLYNSDYSERIRNIEFDYLDVDGVTAASEKVAGIQNQVIENLRRKYVKIEGLSAYPFIVNGDKKLILHIQEDGTEFPVEILDKLIEMKTGNFDFLYKGRTYWTVFSYYESWDWYTGYIIPNVQRFSSLLFFTLIMIGASLCIGAVLWVLLSLFLNVQFKPLQKLDEITREAGQGNLTVSVPIRRNDEIGGISRVFNRFIEELKNIIISIKTAADNNGELERKVLGSVQDSSKQVKEVIHGTGVLVELMDKLNEQVDSSRDAVSSIGEDIRGLNGLIETHVEGVSNSSAQIIDMTRSIESVAAITGKEIEQANDLKAMAHEGGNGLVKTNQAIDAITEYVDDIAGFINMIQSIASQTNLLSMNAAIEAAHAGDAGRGFAVVADEIRKLANQSSEHAKRISSVVKGILSTIGSAAQIGGTTSEGFKQILSRIDALVDSLHTIFENSRNLEQSCGQVRNSTASLGEAVGFIQEKADHTKQQAAQIAESLEVLTRVSGEVSVLIIQIDNNSESTESIMTEIDRSARDMRDAMEMLRTSIERFKTA